MVMAGTFQSTYRNGYNWGDVRIGAKSSSNSWGSCPRHNMLCPSHNMFCPSYNMHLYHAPTITFNFVTGTNRILCPKYNISYCDWNMPGTKKILCPIMDSQSATEKVKLFLDCSCLPEVIANQQADNTTMSDMFKFSRTWCYAVHAMRMKKRKETV